MENHADHVHQKLAPDLYLILLRNPNSHCMLEILLKTSYFERGLSKNI